MKTVLSAIAGLIFTVSSFGQQRANNYFIWPIDNTDKIVFSEVVNMYGSDENTLYANAKHFAAKTFRGERDTIMQNDTTKTIVCKCAFNIPVPQLGERGEGFVSFTFSISCSKNFYKYSLTGLQHFPKNENGVIGGPLENDRAASGGMLFPPKYWEEEKAKCYYRIETTIEQLKEDMYRKSDG